MNNWFECKVKYNKADDQGLTRRVTETYLVDALSFSEAENRIIEERTPYIKGDFSIIGMKKAGINEIYPHEEGDRWFKCKVVFVTVDEVNAKEKKVSTTILVFGSDILSAWNNLKEDLSDTMTDYTVPAIVETSIDDIYPYGNSDKEMEMKKKKPQVLQYDSKAEWEDVMGTQGSSFTGQGDDEDEENGLNTVDGEENDEDEEDENNGKAEEYDLSEFTLPDDDPAAAAAAAAAAADFEIEEQKKKK